MKARDISKYIIEGILGEQSKEKVAIYGGSFRPPTKSDYQLIEKAIEEDPTIDKFIVYVGDSQSEGLDQSDAIKIWEMYKKHLPRDVYVFRADPSPIQAVYNYSNNNPHKDIVWLFGVREGNAEDFSEVAKRTKSISDYPNIVIKPIVFDSNITEREIMAAANMGKDDLEKYIPEDLTYKEIDEIYSMLKPKQIQEDMHSYPDDIINKIVDEGWEYVEIMGNLGTKQAGVSYKARKDGKKYFTLAYERDSSTEPPIQVVTVFWSDEKGKTSSDMVDPGTLRDMEDMIDAADKKHSQLDLNESFSKLDKVVDKISEGGFKQYLPQRLVNYNPEKRKGINDDMKKQAKEDDTSGYFAVFDYIGSAGAYNSTHIDFSDGEGYKFDNLISNQNYEDIKEASLLNEKEYLNEISYESPDPIIEKLVEGDWELMEYETIPGATSSSKMNALKYLSRRDGKNLFTVNFEDDTETVVVMYADSKGETKVDIINNGTEGQVELISQYNVFESTESSLLKEAEEVEYLDIIDKIAEGNYHYIPGKASLHSTYVKTALSNISEKTNKEYFTFSKFPSSFGKDEYWTMVYFSDDPKIYKILGLYTMEQLKELENAGIEDTENFKIEDYIKTKKSDIKEVRQEGDIENDKPVDSIDHYGDIMMFMNKNGLKLEPFPSLEFVDDDEDNAEDLFGKTAYYDPNLNHVVLYTYGRHPKDILRSFAHELVHVHQNHEGRLDNINTTNTNEDDHLEQIEREAYEKGNILFRKWSDQMKEGKKEYGIDAYSAELARLRENKLTVKLVIEKPFQLYCDLNNVLSDGGDRELNWNEEGKTLWDYIKKYDVIILSNDSNVNNKINWINENLPERKSYIFKDKDKKQFYARYNTILIDNREQTIDNWIEAGGIGIVYHLSLIHI